MSIFNNRPSVWTNPIYFLAVGFGIGLIKWIPGTWGTLVAIPFYLLMRPLDAWLYALILLIMILFGIYCCGKAAKDWGTHDHASIVWDEIVGFLLAMFMAPTSWFWVVIGFILFRLFDWIKPWPISWFDKNIKGGLGIVLDDLIAGILVWILIRIMSLF